MDQNTSNLGVIVNDKEGQVKDLTIDQAIIPIRVPDSIFDKMVKAAKFKGFNTVEQWAEATLVQSLTTKIGAPSIESPTQLNNQEVRKITGPSNSGMVKRA